MIQKILIGMNRPEFPKNINGIIACHCGSMLESMQSAYQHWLNGHFDSPVFKYVWEENGIIKESLVDPEQSKCPMCWDIKEV